MSEGSLDLLERRDTREKLAALLQTISKANLSEMPADPIQQLVEVAKVGLQQLKMRSEAGSRRSSAHSSQFGRYTPEAAKPPREAQTQRRVPEPFDSFPTAQFPPASDLHTPHKCPALFPSSGSLPRCFLRRPREDSGAVTERKKYEKNRGRRVDPIRRRFESQYQSMEKEIGELNERKARIQRKLATLDPAGQETYTTLKEAVRLQEELNYLLEKQRLLLDSHAEHIRELRENQTDSFCDSQNSHTDSTSSLNESKPLPPRTPPELARLAQLETNKSDSQELVSLGSTILRPSPSLTRIQIPKEPPTPSKPYVGAMTSRKALYRPSTRYHPLEMSYSDVREDVIARVREKVRELKTGQVEVMVEKYGLDLCACYKHTSEELQMARKAVSDLLEERVAAGNEQQTLLEIDNRKRNPQYCAIFESCAKRAAQLSVYLRPVIDFPLKAASPKKPARKIPSLELIFASEESLHANEIPQSNRTQNLIPLNQIPGPSAQSFASTSSLTFEEGPAVGAVTSVWVDLRFTLGPKQSTARESLISLDFDNSVSFSILWEEDEDRDEWRAVSIEEARRLGLFLY